MTTFNRSPLENNLDKKVREYIKTTYRKDAWFLKVAGSAAQRSGVPDFICCIKGKFICIEDKREDGSGTPSDQQIIECRKIMNAGGHAIISEDFNEIKKFIETVVNEEQI